jgi:hypothetical protein
VRGKSGRDTAPPYAPNLTEPDTHLSTSAATPAGYRVAAADTYVILSRRFPTEDISRWREPRRMYDVSAQGAGKPPELPFFDRGTWEQLLEVRRRADAPVRRPATAPRVDLSTAAVHNSTLAAPRRRRRAEAPRRAAPPHRNGPAGAGPFP